MLKDTKSLGNNKAPACESRGFVLKKKVCFLTHLRCPDFYRPKEEKRLFLTGMKAAEVLKYEVIH